MAARMFAGRSGRFVVLNGDQFYRYSGQILVSIDYGRTFFAQKYHPVSENSPGLRFGRVDRSKVVQATLYTVDVFNNDARATLTLDGGQLTFRGEDYIEVGNTFDPTACEVVPLPLARTETHLWKFSGGYLLKAGDRNDFLSRFYIAGTEAFATDTRPIEHSSDGHTQEDCNEVHFFDHGTQLVMCCQGDVYAGETLKPLEVHKFSYAYSSDGRTVVIKRIMHRHKTPALPAAGK
jgi:hypothetical protein